MEYMCIRLAKDIHGGRNYWNFCFNMIVGHRGMLLFKIYILVV